MTTQSISRPQGVRRTSNGKGVLLMGLGMFVFSIVDVSAKYLTEGLHPMQIVWTRQLGLLAGAIVFLTLQGPGIFRTQHPFLQTLRGLMAATSAALFIFAVAYVPIADAAAITFVAPFIVTVLGALILREPVGVRRWVAVILGFVGSMIVIRPGMGVLHPASGLLILAALFFAIRQIISRAIADTDRTPTTVVYTAIVSVVVLSAPLPFVWSQPSGFEMLLLIEVALLAALGEILVIKALETAMAVVVAPVQYTLIIWATCSGWLVFGQLPDAWTWLGTAIIVSTGLYMLRREYIVTRTGQ